MKCLWLTLADPDPPLNGQFLYSSGLIKSAEAAGMDLDVVGFSLPNGIHEDGQQAGRINWHLAPHQPRSRWLTNFSRLPRMAHRTSTRRLGLMVHDLLRRDDWEAIVFDSLDLAWALSLVIGRYRDTQKRPKLVYLSHNHEETAARLVARSQSHAVKRAHKHIDALKVMRLERAVCRHAALITSNTPEDCDKFRRQWPGKTVTFLPPGYSGERRQTREINASVSRRAIVVGSFDWIAKRQSLEEFLGAADHLFTQAGIALDVVGQADEAFLDRLRQTYVAFRFTGRVDDVAVYMKDARIALVPDQMGGFKLKGLDYVFNRLPIFAITDSLPGMPLLHGESAAFFPNPTALAEGVVRSIDDFDHLNALQNSAYEACSAGFDWSAIGRRLYGAIIRPDHRRDNTQPEPSLEAGEPRFHVTQ